MTLLHKLHESLKMRNMKHEVLSRNIANSSTPKFKAKDIDLSKQGSFASALSVNMTNKMHIAGRKKPNAKITEDNNKKFLKPNGNNVNLPDQMFKINQNQQKHQQLLKLTAYLEEMIRTAVGK